MTSPTDYVSEELRKELAALQGSRVNTLGASRDLQVMMHALLQHEARRIEQKLGRQHPRSQRLHARLQTGLDVINTLEVEHQLTQVQMPDVADQVAFIHGRVVDENRRGFVGLAVCLVDGRSTPIRDVEGAMTARTGYYALTLDRAVIDTLGRTHATGVFLAVFTAKGRFLHREQKPLPLAAGLRLLVNVGLSRQALAQGERPVPPCEPDAGDGQPPTRTVSVPDLIGRPEQEALAILQRHTLQGGKRQAQPTTEKIGLVLAQEPAAGTAVAVGTAVSLVIGVADLIQVPDVVGLRVDEAGTRLQHSGLVVGQVSRRPDERVDIVLAQEPRAGEQVSRGAPVNLVVGRRRLNVGETIIGRIERHPRFAQLGVSPQELGEYLEGLSIESLEQAATLLDRPNPDLRDALGLSSLRRTQTFKGILRQVLAQPE